MVHINHLGACSLGLLEIIEDGGEKNRLIDLVWVVLPANYYRRTIQELHGHSDIRTTMTYTHTVRSIRLKEVKAP